MEVFFFPQLLVIIDRGDICSTGVSLHQDMRSPRFAYKNESGQPDIMEVLSKHAFPLCHNLVSVILQMFSIYTTLPHLVIT